eukprot:9899718-Alexandrium_andersonii.AAC.1
MRRAPARLFVNDPAHGNFGKGRVFAQAFTDSFTNDYVEAGHALLQSFVDDPADDKLPKPQRRQTGSS